MKHELSLQSIFEISWRLFRERGWRLCCAMLIAALPIAAYAFALRLELIPNLFSSVSLWAGDRPSISEDGWLSLFWYLQKITIVNGVVFAILFGWLNAISLTLCAFIVLDWESERTSSLSQRIRQLYPTALIVWILFIITKFCSLVLNAAFFLPALIIGAFWYVSTLVAVDERVGPIESLKKSYILTRQYIWGVFALVCIFFFLGIGTGQFRARVMIQPLLGSGYEVQHVLNLDLAMRLFFSFVQGFASMIVVASTYLVLRRVNAGLKVPHLAD